MKAARKELWKKISLIFFLFLLILGFTIPGFLPEKAVSEQPFSPKICQTDSDCTLSCQGQQTLTYCFQNLCQRNDCEVKDFYPFQPLPKTFTLQVDIEGQPLDLPSRQQEGNLFVRFHEEKVDLFTTRLTLQQVLEKVNLQLQGGCLTVDGVSYCGEGKKELSVRVNGKEQSEFYPPQEGDGVEITYGEKTPVLAQII